MKNKWIYWLIGIGIGVIVLIGNLGLFSIFTPSEEKLTQYIIKHPDDGELRSLIEGRVIGRLSNIRNENRDPLLNTNIANEIIINSGKNEFKFVSTLGWGESSILSGSGCLQTIQIYKNNQLKDTIQHDTLSMFLNQYNWGGKEYKYYDDEKQDSYVSFETMKQPARYNNPDAGFQHDCPYAINEYSLKLSNDSFDFNISIPETNIIPGQDITVRTIINNKLSSEYLADIDLALKVQTILGPVEKTFTIYGFVLNPGENILDQQIPVSSSSGSIEANIKLTLKVRGDSFQGLNYGISNTRWASLDEQGRCSSTYPCYIYESSAKKQILASDWIPIGDVDSNIIVVDFGTVCNTDADTNCDGMVDRTELGIVINDWIGGTTTRTKLGEAIMAWVGE